MNGYESLLSRLRKKSRTWLVTGAAGFIGSNLVEALLRVDQKVIGLDNFATGRQTNLNEVLDSVSRLQRSRFEFIRGDIGDGETCRRACHGVDHILHQAALGSVPRSIKDPRSTNEANVTGFLNLLEAARETPVRRFVYASSSAIYGDAPELPKREERTGRPLSPYAVTKVVNELYADVFTRIYGVESIGLRYFNVFGPRQDPEGPYAAVIPRWIGAMIRNEPAIINGDGSTSRDFCHVANVVQANLLAATCDNSAAVGEVFNVACNTRTTLLELFELLRLKLLPRHPHLRHYKPKYAPSRQGDIQHSLAEIRKARTLMGYEPSRNISDGLDESLGWYEQNLRGEWEPSQGDALEVQFKK